MPGGKTFQVCDQAFNHVTFCVSQEATDNAYETSENAEFDCELLSNH